VGDPGGQGGGWAALAAHTHRPTSLSSPPPTRAPDFALNGEASRFGQWGAVEDWHNMTTPKFCAVSRAIGTGIPPGC
jgi:hypothetical protein